MSSNFKLYEDFHSSYPVLVPVVLVLTSQGSDGRGRGAVGARLHGRTVASCPVRSTTVRSARVGGGVCHHSMTNGCRGSPDGRDVVHKAITGCIPSLLPLLQRGVTTSCRWDKKRNAGQLGVERPISI